MLISEGHGLWVWPHSGQISHVFIARGSGQSQWEVSWALGASVRCLDSTSLPGGALKTGHTPHSLAISMEARWGPCAWG